MIAIDSIQIILACGARNWGQTWIGAMVEEHKLTEQMFAAVRSLLEEKRLLLKSGTIVDATIIAAPPSTKNADKARDPEMHQTRKGKQWHFGMKAHVGTDKHGTVHTLVTTAANEADISQLPELLHGEEKELLGDQAYWSEFHRQCAQEVGVRYRVNRRGNHSHPLTDWQKSINRTRSKVRARGEHAFHVIKRLWGFSKVRSRVGEEHGAVVHGVCAGESLPAAATIVATRGDVSLVNGRKAEKSRKSPAYRLSAIRFSAFR